MSRPLAGSAPRRKGGSPVAMIWSGVARGRRAAGTVHRQQREHQQADAEQHAHRAATQLDGRRCGGGPRRQFREERRWRDQQLRQLDGERAGHVRLSYQQVQPLAQPGSQVPTFSLDRARGKPAGPPVEGRCPGTDLRAEQT